MRIENKCGWEQRNTDGELPNEIENAQHDLNIRTENKGSWSNETPRANYPMVLRMNRMI